MYRYLKYRMCADCGDSHCLFYARYDGRFKRVVILGKCKLCHLDKQNERQRSYWHRVRKFKKGVEDDKKRKGIQVNSTRNVGRR